MSHKGNTKYLKNIIDDAHNGLGTNNHDCVWLEDFHSQDLKL